VCLPARSERCLRHSRVAAQWYDKRTRGPLAVGEQLLVEVLGSFPAPKAFAAESPGAAPRVVMLSFRVDEPAGDIEDGSGDPAGSSEGTPYPPYSPHTWRRSAAGPWPAASRGAGSTERPHVAEERIAALEARLAVVEWHLGAMQKMMQTGAASQGAHLVPVMPMAGAGARVVPMMAPVHLGRDGTPHVYTSQFPYFHVGGTEGPPRPPGTSPL